MDIEILSLINKLNEKYYYKDREIQNVFSFTTDGIYNYISYGNITVAHDVDTSFNSIEEIKKSIKEFMINLSNELKKDSKLLDCV